MKPKLLTAIAAALLLAACQGETPAATEAAATEPPADSTASTKCVAVPPKEPVACTMEWKPVCGCDGVTYGHGGGARGAGITEFTEGECGPERLD